MKRFDQFLIGMVAALSLSCVGVWGASCAPSSASVSGGNASISADGESSANAGTEGLAYYPTDSGAYAVSIGNAKELSEVVLPAAHNGKAVTTVISDGFDGDVCSTKVTKVVIAEGITTLDQYAFYNCSGLRSVEIPNSVTSIGVCAFDGCSSLTDITYLGTKAEWGTIGKGSYWNSFTGNYTVHCSDGDMAKE
jgi:hypothetical protein